MSSELKLRILSGAALAAISIVALLLGGWVFVLYCACAAGLMIWELCRMSAGPQSQKAAGVFLAGYAPVIVAQVLTPWMGVIAALAAAFALVGVHPDRKFRSPALVVLGSGIIALASIFLVELRQMPNGLVIALWLPIIVAFADMGGYFAGRKFGGPKLAPALSPKKTWSGAIGGLIAASAASVIFALASGGNALFLGGLGMVTAIVSQAGDLCESWLKRRFGVKDSSNLIPGHGGVMDRFDGLAASAIWIGLLLSVFPSLERFW